MESGDRLDPYVGFLFRCFGLAGRRAGRSRRHNQAPDAVVGQPDRSAGAGFPGRASPTVVGSRGEKNHRAILEAAGWPASGAAGVQERAQGALFGQAAVQAPWGSGIPTPRADRRRWRAGAGRPRRPASTGHGHRGRPDRSGGRQRPSGRPATATATRRTAPAVWRHPPRTC